MPGNLLQCVTLLTALWCFYYGVKKCVFFRAPRWAARFTLNEAHPFSVWVGAVELMIVAIMHGLFCLSLLWWYGISFHTVFQLSSLSHLCWGVLIGAGLLGLAVLCCTAGIAWMEFLFPTRVPRSLAAWGVITQAGWLRHHRYLFRCFPVLIAILIITLQVGSEEIIFRMIVPSVLGKLFLTMAPVIAVLLFVYMQQFHMPCWISASFPMTGAFVMGVAHQILLTQTQEVLPLIVSHVIFFLLSLRM